MLCRSSAVVVLRLGATAAALLAPLAANAQILKRSDIPGFALQNLSANDGDDVLPRVSTSGLVVWSGRYNLAGAASGADDHEVLLWDGATLTQITDDDVDQLRPVVNDFGDMAWQIGDGDASTEIAVSVDGVIAQPTDDPSPGVIDRYPDINDARIVVWGRLTPEGYEVCIYDALAGGPFAPIGAGYRPHIDSAGHIHAAGINGIFDSAYHVVVPMADPSAFGYRQFRRSEIADGDRLALEAERLGPAQPDFVGPRDILFWDGASMHTVFRSPGPWHGRADLNADGVVAWEGFGGLPGSASGTADAEIFVYRPELRQIVQLTDDDELDIWPTVSDDGRVVWMGTGNYPGAPGGRLDREIFIATPNADADSDGVPDQADNCPLRANADQRDRGRVGSLLPDGIGDACQCGDVSNNGLVSNRDVSAFRDALAAGQVGSLAAPQKCRVNGALAPCSIADLAILRRALEAAGPLEPGIEQLCDAALQF